MDKTKTIRFFTSSLFSLIFDKKQIYSLAIK